MERKPINSHLGKAFKLPLFPVGKPYKVLGDVVLHDDCIHICPQAIPDSAKKICYIADYCSAIAQIE